MTKAIYPGSFDPVTLGHLDIIERAATIFDQVIVSVSINLSKNPMFSLHERVELVKEATKHLQNVRVETFDGLLIDYMKTHDIKIIVKGLRAVSDFEYEFQMALMNKSLAKEFDTIFLMSNPKYLYLSSSIVKEVAKLGGKVSDYVPAVVAKELARKNKSIE